MRSPFSSRALARAEPGGGSRPWLSIEGLVVGYGAAPVLRDVTLHVEPREIVAVIGPNGAGKTTLLNTICGLVKPAQGEIWFDGRRVDGLPPHSIVKLGIAHVPEGRRLFPEMTIYENLLMGGYLRRGHGEVKSDLAALVEKFPILGARHSQKAGTASGGEQQILAVARALMAKPRLLLMDEPTIGLAPQVVQELARTIIDITTGYDVSIVLVEQNAQIALSLADRGYVLDLGRVSIDGTRDELLADDRVREVYLSRRRDEASGGEV